MIKNLDFLKTGENALTLLKSALFEKQLDVKEIRKIDPLFEKFAKLFWNKKYAALLKQSEAALSNKDIQDTSRLFYTLLYCQYYDQENIDGFDSVKLKGEKFLITLREWLQEYEIDLTDKIGYYTLLSSFYILLLNAFNKTTERLNYLAYFQQKFQSNLTWVDLEIQEKLNYLKTKWYSELPYKAEAIGISEGELYDAKVIET